ncbi:MAG: hypothetical protein SW833_03170 [Cyanobacteriota bacterium]|nr:hypothetical protein [Cyanobacteriota bacterium]
MGYSQTFHPTFKLGAYALPYGSNPPFDGSTLAIAERLHRSHGEALDPVFSVKAIGTTTQHI